MKALISTVFITVIVSLASVFFFPHACMSPKKKIGFTAIKDVRGGEKPIEKPANHQARDIEVYRTALGLNEAYMVFFYLKENRTVKSHQAIFNTDKVYDEAEYKWLNDSTVSIRLFNTIYYHEVRFKVYGKGSSTGMIADSN